MKSILGLHNLSMLFDNLFVNGDTKQAFIAVASMLEAGLICQHKILLDVCEVVLYSDNASGYYKAVLPIMVPFIANANVLCLQSLYT